MLNVFREKFRQGNLCFSAEHPTPSNDPPSLFSLRLKLGQWDLDRLILVSRTRTDMIRERGARPLVHARLARCAARCPVRKTSRKRISNASELESGRGSLRLVTRRTSDERLYQCVAINSPRLPAPSSEPRASRKFLISIHSATARRSFPGKPIDPP